MKFEMTMCGRSSSMNDSFRDSLVIEFAYFFSGMEIVDDRRSSFTSVNGDIGLVDLGAEVGREVVSRLVILCDSGELPLLGVSNSVGQD